MPSRKTLLMGAGALAVVAIVVVLITRDTGPSPAVERGDGSAFPLRGSLAEDKDAIDAALAAWKDGRGGAAARMTDADVHLLYAGTVGERDIVIARQGTRLIALHQPLHRGWVVGAARDGFDPFDGEPVTLDNANLLPAGDWTYLPLRDRGTRPLTVDGLVADGSAYGGLDPGLAVESTEPVAGKVTKVYDSEAGTFRADARGLRAIMDASRRRGALTAIHAALVAGADEDARASTAFRPVDVLWAGSLRGLGQAAVVAHGARGQLGLGIVRDPNGFVSSAQSLSLGARSAPLAARRRDAGDPATVGAAYVGGGDDEPETLVAAATRPVDRIELLVGTKRVTRPGPVALVPVDWDTTTTDAVVLGRTRSGAVVAPLVPASP